MHNCVLIIDDNEQFCMSLSRMLGDESLEIQYALCSRAALPILKNGGLSVILLDVQLGNESGLSVLKMLKENFTTIPVIMLTGFGTIETAVESMRYGAFDYLLKPVKYKVIYEKIQNAISCSIKPFYIPESDIVSQDTGIKALKTTILKLASGNLPILLYGENGTGKEMFADFIFNNGNRSNKPFIKVNCAAFPDNLLDNELFGHEKGAYTGAHTSYEGVFERASGGTLFLDEIGDMTLEVQAKVLRVIQNRELYRLGGKDLIRVDVKLISATNKKLEDLISIGKFREDLYYRLNAALMEIPPLKKRISDIPLLAKHFLDEFTIENGTDSYILKGEVLELFMRYSWPGNIRELKNTLNYASAITPNGIIGLECLPVQLQKFGSDENLEETPLESSEKETILRELLKANFNKKKVAESLNISRTTLYNRMKKYNITGYNN